MSAQVLSVVCALTGKEPNLDGSFESLHREITSLDVLLELIVVLRGQSTDSLSTLRSIASKWDCMRIYVMEDQVDVSTALFAGIENSIGDWIVTIDIETDESAIVRRLFQSALLHRAEVALSVPYEERRPFIYSLLSRAFHRIFLVLNGFNLRTETPTARLLSRVVVGRLLRDESPLIAFETLTAQVDYRKCFVPSRSRRPVERHLGQRARIRWRTLVGISTAPLRVTNICLCLIAGTALAYSIYNAVMHILRGEAISSSTALSLMLSLMFLFLSLALWMISEYIMLILDPSTRRPKYEIASEYGSTAELSLDILNVESEL